MTDLSGEYPSHELSVMIKVFMKALRYKDAYTQAHSHRVGFYAEHIAEAMNLSTDEIYVSRVLGVLHDIGKLFVPNSILLKPGALTCQEWVTMRKHSTDAVRILSCLSVHDQYLLIVKSLHERYDGKGYPDGIKENQIPLIARIISVADSYDAMITDRPYRKALSPEEAREELERERSKQFSPEVVDVMLELLASNGKFKPHHGNGKDP